MAKQVFSLDFCGRNLTVETGEIAKQAGGSVVVRYDDTVVLSAATANKYPKDIDFFPLTVSFEEKLYAENGRGIMIMAAWMDRVLYNRAGNEVLLVKRL